MIREEIIEKAEKLNWFHCIELCDGYVTKGVADHCTEESATNRYGLPIDLSGKHVLDIGCNNGYFSFLSEKRGAVVSAIDPNQGNGDNIKCFELASEILKSNVLFKEQRLIDSIAENPPKMFDISLYYGVLYHVENPLLELKMLFKHTREFALIETAIAQNGYGNRPVWELNEGFDNDPSNAWYPSLGGLTAALKYVGFSQVELIYSDGIRATVKAIV